MDTRYKDLNSVCGLRPADDETTGAEETSPLRLPCARTTHPGKFAQRAATVPKAPFQISSMATDRRVAPNDVQRLFLGAQGGIDLRRSCRYAPGPAMDLDRRGHQRVVHVWNHRGGSGWVESASTPLRGAMERQIRSKVGREEARDLGDRTTRVQRCSSAWAPSLSRIFLAQASPGCDGLVNQSLHLLQCNGPGSARLGEL